eukprot:4781220-Amphidinium_carterae.1
MPEIDDPSEVCRTMVEAYGALAAEQLTTGPTALTVPTLIAVTPVQRSMHDSTLAPQIGPVQLPLDSTGFLVGESIPMISRD